MSRANTRLLDRGGPVDGVSVPAPQFFAVVNHDDDHQVPRVLRIKVRALKQGVSEDVQAQLAQFAGGAGVWWNRDADTGVPEPWYGGAAMRIRFGSEPGIFRDIIADLREGEYNIPPCKSITVTAAFWSPGDDETGYTAQLQGLQLEVAAEIADGETIESSPLILTAQRDIRLAAPEYGWANCYAPPGAYAFDAGGEHQAIYGISGGRYFERNPDTGKWVPPSTPILLTSGVVGIGLVDQRDGDADAPGTWPAIITFFVR